MMEGIVERLREEARLYRLGPSGEGPHAGNWADKPHRLVYDLCGRVEACADTIQSLQADNAALRERVAELEKAGRYINPYLVWTIGHESPGHHPTMPSAVAEFQSTLGKSALSVTQALIGKEQS